MTIRVWLSETQDKKRFRLLMTVVIDVDCRPTQRTERIYFQFFENGLDQKRLNINARAEATPYRLHETVPFWKTCLDWKAGLLSLDKIKDMVDQKIPKEVKA